MKFRFFPPVPEAELPPKYRIRKIPESAPDPALPWCLLRLYPVRHTLYFPIAWCETYEDVLEEICKREGICEP